MGAKVPSWLNRAFMEKVLRKSENDNTIQVTDILAKAATDKGDNYASDMIRINVEYTRDQAGRKVAENIAIILKLAPIEEGVRKEMVLNSGIFNTEMMMMTDTLRQMNTLVGPDLAFNARALYTQEVDPVFLALEDLAPKGYRMADRQAGLDLEHSLLAMRGLGRFHAASVRVCEMDPKQKLLYRRGMLNQSNKDIAQFFIMGTMALANEVRNWPELDPKYADKIQKIADKIYDFGGNIMSCKEDEFNVINHGDAWVNNMLFKYDENRKPVKHIFVDFQMSYYASPAIDLLYFLSTSPSSEVLENSKQKLLNEYFSTLTSTMKQIGCKTRPPTMEHLQKMMKDKAVYGMVASFTVLPVVLIDKSEAKSIDEMMSKDGSYENPSYKGKIYRKVMAKRIPHYDEIGLLDI